VPRKSITRFKPPGDVVKLQDRLYYLLQPPLESLLTDEAVPVPFEPFPYQFEGIGFLYPRYAAILADEMGLGKTMQAIMSIRLLLRAGELARVLLVCPKPLVTNWRREFSVWAPEVPLAIIEGDQAKRHWQWLETETPVKIANYELLMRDRELLLEQVDFDLVVLDEAQRIKNRSSTTSEIVRGISRRRSWALSGTPVENSHEDLIGIFEFLAPGYLHSGMAPKQLGQAARDYILRRTKDKVLTELPPKMFRDAELELSPPQWERYQAAENEGVLKLSEMGDGITIQHVFELVLRLKQICNFDPATGASCKLERLEADLEEVVASGQKAIVFSQWVVTIKRLAKALSRFHPLEYHGQMPSKQRDAIIDQFRNDPTQSVLLMSYGAGSVGLNLQFCRYVFLFDRWWNPAVEDQAINRAHRIGAAGPVTVTRMLTVGTIEERINQVLEEKRELFAAILSHTDGSPATGLTREEIFGLFRLKLARPRPNAA
jgi:SNF2 family DNA or RNA helicase